MLFSHARLSNTAEDYWASPACAAQLYWDLLGHRNAHAMRTRACFWAFSLPQWVSKDNNVVLGAEMTSNAVSIENAVKNSKASNSSISSNRQCSDIAQTQGAGVGYDP